MSRTFEENLRRYAELAVKLGVAVQPGQELILAADVADAHLVHLIVEEAYKAGAKHVQVLYTDEANTLTKFRHGSDEAISYAPKWIYDGQALAFEGNAARLGIFGGDPSLLKSIDPQRVATASKVQSQASKHLSEYIADFRVNWCLIGSASPAWARQVFPNLPQEQAMEKLWEAILLTSRVLEEDPLAAWGAHCDLLEQKQDWLNSLELDAVHFKGGGTDLRVGLVDGHVWVGGWGKAKNGVRCSPNVPTEEIFTMPHRARVDGIVRSTKPLSVRGQLVDGIEMEFKDGAVVNCKASAAEETLLKLIDTDEGGRRLGEVALVPNSSKVSQSGVLFLNSLYDENAASHIAMGRCYSENLNGYDGMSEEERIAHGANDSLIHVDWMIGSGEIDVDGIRKDGSTMPLMRAGEWAG